MKVAVFDPQPYEQEALALANEGRHNLIFVQAQLDSQTLAGARGCEAVACFANDKLNAENLKSLHTLGVRLIALRSAGFNHVDLSAAKEIGLPVVRVPEYSPYSVAEHAVALLMSLNRKTHRAYSRVREMNFSLHGLLGFDLHGKTVGVIGTGRIGRAFCKIMHGFGCRLLAYDVSRQKELESSLGVQYVALDELLRQSDVISLHVPLNEKTRHILDARAFSLMKPAAILLNTGRGGLIDTKALIGALKSHRLGAAGLDVYEEEEHIFFHDLSETGIDDEILARLLTFPNVLITSHQGFFTKEALAGIAQTTIFNLDQFANGEALQNAVVP